MCWPLDIYVCAVAGRQRERRGYRSTACEKKLGITPRSNYQLARSEMAERIDVEVTGKSQFEVAHEMARFILIDMEGRQVKSISRHEFLHLVADCIEALRGIKVKEIVS
jgi:hypothetical protein